MQPGHAVPPLCEVVSDIGTAGVVVDQLTCFGGNYRVVSTYRGPNAKEYAETVANQPPATAPVTQHRRGSTGSSSTTNTSAPTTMPSTPVGQSGGGRTEASSEAKAAAASLSLGGTPAWSPPRPPPKGSPTEMETIQSSFISANDAKSTSAASKQQTVAALLEHMVQFVAWDCAIEACERGTGGKKQTSATHRDVNSRSTTSLQPPPYNPTAVVKSLAAREWKSAGQHVVDLSAAQARRYFELLRVGSAEGGGNAGTGGSTAGQAGTSANEAEGRTPRGESQSLENQNWSKRATAGSNVGTVMSGGSSGVKKEQKRMQGPIVLSHRRRSIGSTTSGDSNFGDGNEENRSGGGPNPRPRHLETSTEVLNAPQQITQAREGEEVGKDVAPKYVDAARTKVANNLSTSLNLRVVRLLHSYYLRHQLVGFHVPFFAYYVAKRTAAMHPNDRSSTAAAAAEVRAHVNFLLRHRLAAEITPWDVAVLLCDACEPMVKKLQRSGFPSVMVGSGGSPVGAAPSVGSLLSSASVGGGRKSSASELVNASNRGGYMDFGGKEDKVRTTSCQQAPRHRGELGFAMQVPNGVEMADGWSVCGWFPAEGGNVDPVLNQPYPFNAKAWGGNAASSRDQVPKRSALSSFASPGTATAGSDAMSRHPITKRIQELHSLQADTIRQEKKAQMQRATNAQKKARANSLLM